jgi:hypothetical protein
MNHKIPMTIRIAFLAASLALTSLAAGCKSKPSCDEVVDHTLTLIPAELKAHMGDKKDMIEKCEKKTDEERACANAAASFEDLMKCK